MSDPDTGRGTSQGRDELLHKFRIAVTWRTAFLLTILPSIALMCAGCIFYATLRLFPNLNMETYKILRIIKAFPIGMISMSPLFYTMVLVDVEWNKCVARMHSAGYRQVQPRLRTLVYWVALIALFVANQEEAIYPVIRWIGQSQLRIYIGSVLSWLSVTAAIWIFTIGPMLWFSVKVEDDEMMDTKQTLEVESPSTRGDSEIGKMAMNTEMQPVDLEGSFVHVEEGEVADADDVVVEKNS